MKKHKLKVTIALLAVAVAHASPAFAQVEQPATDAASEAETNDGEEIVVTATRRDTTSQNTPLTISALSADTLANRGIRSVDDIAFAVPGLSFVSDNDGTESLSVRGIVALGSTATTSLYLDETPISQLRGGTGKFSPRYFDIERVEVLRGPQGTLYGASSMGGAVRIITKKPNLSRFEGAIRVEGSTTKLGKENGVIDGAINVPIISDRLALRITGFYEKNSGWVKNFRPSFSANPTDYVDLGADGIPNNDITDPAAPGYDPLNRNDDIAGVAYAGLASNNGTRVGGEVIYGGRAALRAEPSDAIALTASYAWQKRENTGSNSADRSISLGLSGTDFRQARSFSEFRTLRSQLANFTAEADLGFAKLTSSTSYEWNKERVSIDANALLLGNVVNASGGIPQDATGRIGVGITSSIQPKNALTQEVRIVSSGDSPLNWIIGGFYNKTKVRQVQNLPTFGLSAALVGTPLEGAAPNDSFGASDLFEPRREISVFGELGYKFSDALSATVGIRRYDVKSGSSLSITGLASGGAAPLPLRFVSDKGFTYKALLNYKPADDILFFAGYTTGYRPGGVNPPRLLATDTFPFGFTSDKLAQYEFGWKTRFLDRKLTFNGALFYIDWKDIPTEAVAPSGISFTFNGPKARTYGGELELIARPTKGMDFTLGATVLNAKYNADFPAQGILKGVSLPNVPEYTVNAAFNYEWGIGGDNMARINANVAHVSSRQQIANDPTSKLPGLITAGLSAGVSFGQFDLSIFARNIFDERAVIGNSPQGLEIVGGKASTVSYVSYMQPRTIGASLQFAF
jgi:iron complex outermembrane recepter protein